MFLVNDMCVKALVAEDWNKVVVLLALDPSSAGGDTISYLTGHLAYVDSLATSGTEYMTTGDFLDDKNCSPPQYQQLLTLHIDRNHLH